MFQCIFGASPFLGACAVRDPRFLRTLWEHGPDRCAEDILASIRSLRPDRGREEVASALRTARRRMALTAGLADIASLWTLETFTGALTRLAEEGPAQRSFAY